MKGVFTSSPASDMLIKGKRDGKYGRAIAWIDDLPDDKYAEGAVLNKMEGTVVPRHSDLGGIKGTTNVFGFIQGGVISTVGPDGQVIQVGQVDVTPIWKNAQKPLPAELKALSKNQTKREEELQEISMQAGEPVELKQATFTLTPPEEEEVPPIKKFTPHTTLVPATLKGNFGTFKGEYRYVYTTDDYVILVADADNSVYTPPANKEPFSISCSDGDFVVYFVGMEFSLPFANVLIQLFIRAGE